MPPLTTDDLSTVDFDGVPILAAGGPFFGTGSPPEGDHFTTDQLEALAAASSKNEVKAPIKIGHSKEQKLLKDSGLSPDEQPAAGWLENFRVEGDQMLADLKGVPAKLAKLMKAKAFRTRSVEISRLRSQEDDGKPMLAVTGLALLGAKAPAVRTLDDIAAMYGDEGLDADLLVAMADFDLGYAAAVWTPEQGYEAIRSDVQSALAQLTPTDARGMSVEPGYWVRDVSHSAALVQRYEDGQDKTWVVPFTRTTDGSVKLASQADWTEAEQQWVAMSEASAERFAASTTRKEGGAGDAPILQPMKITDLTDEQVRTLADTLGVEEADEAKLREAVAQRVTGLVQPEDPTPDPAGAVSDPQSTPAPTPVLALSEDEVTALRRDAALGKQAYEAQKAAERESVLRSAVEKGKLAPAALENFRSFYDADADACIKAIDDLPVNADLLRALGSDGEGEGGSVESEDAEYRAFAAAMGLPTGEEA